MQWIFNSILNPGVMNKLIGGVKMNVYFRVYLVKIKLVLDKFYSIN